MPGFYERISKRYRKARPIFRTILIVLMLMVLCGVVYQITRVTEIQWKETLGAIAAVIFVALVDRLAFFLELAARTQEWQEQLETRLLSLQEEHWKYAEKAFKAIYPASAKAGIVAVYGSRKDAAESILEDIRDTAEKSRVEAANGSVSTHRVWLLGISFTEGVQLESILPDLDTVARLGRPNQNVRVLLLYPFRSPAMFRTFLESTPDAIGNILNFDRGTTAQNSDPFYSQTVYSRFEYSYRRLMQSQSLRENVRFYGHYPTSWLLIIDQVAYFEPYTFGRASDSSEGECLGGMPVLKIQRQAGGVAFDILEDHFKKLWATSDVDLFHLEVKLEERHQLVQDVFRQRDGWLRQVYRVLYSRTGDDVPGPHDRRRFTRQPCFSCAPLLTLNWDATAQATAELIDFSARGLRLKVRTGTTPQAQQAITVEGLADKTPSSLLIARHFHECCNDKFSVLPPAIGQSQDIIRLKSSA